MAKLTILKDTCKGCLLCKHVCPKGVLGQDHDKPNKRGYYPIQDMFPEKCIACGLCALMCPDCVIKVEKE